MDIHNEPVQDETSHIHNLLESLSTVPHKPAYYRREPYFREAWSELQGVYGREAEMFALRHALVILKPDAIVARKIEQCASLLAEAGFTPCATRSFWFDRNMVRALWLYKLNAATLGRLRVLDLLQLAAPSLFILLRDEESVANRPASVRLTALKGRGASQRNGHSNLRRRLGAKGRILSFIHSADEPADLVREMAIIFGRSERKQIFRDVRVGRSAVSPGACAECLYRTWPRHELHLDLALSRMSGLATRSGYSQSAYVDELVSICEGNVPQTSTVWLRFLQLVEFLDLKPGIWDLITVGAHFADESQQGDQPVLGDVSCEAWDSRYASDGAAAQRII